VAIDLMPATRKVNRTPGPASGQQRVTLSPGAVLDATALGLYYGETNLSLVVGSSLAMRVHDLEKLSPEFLVLRQKVQKVGLKAGEIFDAPLCDQAGEVEPL
jgi:hypothetical protein